MAPRTNQRQATNRGQLAGRALDPYRERITQLYKIEKRPLNEVMGIIGQESKMDVFSMEKMFKDRLRLWNVKRNLSRTDVAAAL
ncbi:hypothetical protein GJ744_002062 [Endocarpon pusillum]|uniref:Clr5 domain-containing protein n=1 Tax=Endocarpon pusillum TaxID=364733 RepID=A0A8H7E073_9EURO|nr:hypothetical protein GJ744_002062 [Endocarpon pusillum]